MGLSAERKLSLLVRPRPLKRLKRLKRIFPRKRLTRRWEIYLLPAAATVMAGWIFLMRPRPFFRLFRIFPRKRAQHRNP
jgi:hypothetical protein